MWSRSCRDRTADGCAAQARTSTGREEQGWPAAASTPGRSVTSRAPAVLDAFDSSAPRLTLSEIAERPGIPLTTAHRLLGELAD